MSADDRRQALYTGGCQCGAVRFAFFAEPLRISLCHCRMCQRAVSSPYAILAESKEADFAWTHGTPATYQSSSHAKRDFCAACGTPLSYRAVDGNVIELLVCAFDRPDDLAPSYAVGIESKLPWADKLHRLPGKTTAENSGPEFERTLEKYQSNDD